MNGTIVIAAAAQGFTEAPFINLTFWRGAPRQD